MAQLQLQDLRQAWEARDPDLVRLIETLASQEDPIPEEPIRQEAYTFDRFIAEIQSKSFRKKPEEEQMHLRQEKMKMLEAPNAEVPLSDRLRLHEILFLLWEDKSLFARQMLLKVIAKIPLVYGPWRALKKIFKEAEERNDTEIYGALAARFDMACSRPFEVKISRMTLGYLVRRAWRYLRRLATQLPVAYPDVVCDFLCRYTNETNWPRTWIACHIFYHGTGSYSRSGFSFWRVPDDILKNRAYPELWKRTPRPLFSLLERAKSEQVRHFATTALKTDFRASLREVEPSWVARLVSVQSRSIDDFVIWILNNVPRFEQGAFRDLGLHDAVLKLFESQSNSARTYAANYARAHARDLPLSDLICLMNNDNKDVRSLAEDLLKSRDPRKDVGLDAWGELLESEHAHKLAAEMIRNNFGARELTTEWFKARLLTRHSSTFTFAKKLLPQIHSRDSLGVSFFQDLVEGLWRLRQETLDWQYFYSLADQQVRYVIDELKAFEVNQLPTDFLQCLFLHDTTSSYVRGWVEEGRLKPQTLPVTFFKCLSFEPDWDESEWIKNLKSTQTWAEDLSFPRHAQEQILDWLKDVRRFSTSDLGFDWLLKLVRCSEPVYHDFAVEVLSKSFVPADFAPKDQEILTSGDTKATVDLGGSTFVFTGKLKTMTRDEAKKKVQDAGGKFSSSVTKKLHYLVIGDEGSPLYGEGTKGSKQVKAEELNASGANIQIISETSFLQRLTEGEKSHSQDEIFAGCKVLWEMAIAPGAEDAELAKFARRYIRRHHLDLGQEKSDRPVEAGTEMPSEFFTWELVRPLFSESRKPVRDLALDLARWEFARWTPSVSELIRLLESPFAEVRDFVARSLLAEDSPENARFRIDPDQLSASAVYSFCESPDEETRTLGMQLIQRSPRLQIPEELFRLTESADRRVRGFVIRSLWSLYRDRGITPEWRPSLPPQPTTGQQSAKDAQAEKKRLGEGAPSKPEQLPASKLTLEKFLRRILFEIPPGRMEASRASADGVIQRMKPLSARKAKLSLIEMLRDLALQDAELATTLLPLLTEFMQSRGRSEEEACLVAVTRIRHFQEQT